MDLALLERLIQEGPKEVSTPTVVADVTESSETRSSAEEEAVVAAQALPLDEEDRDALTVVLLNMSLKASERDVWEFFTEKCGRVRDIRIVRDPRTKKSKGVAYVEFFDADSVGRALQISGRAYIASQPVVIKVSGAEKNRAARDAKKQAVRILEREGGLRVFVGGLVGPLACLSEEDLCELFSPFGAIEEVDIGIDPISQITRGYAFIKFTFTGDARDAISSMNGFEISDQHLRVGHARDLLAKTEREKEEEHKIKGREVGLRTNLETQSVILEDGSVTSSSRADLMKNLLRGGEARFGQQR